MHPPNLPSCSPLPNPGASSPSASSEHPSLYTKVSESLFPSARYPTLQRHSRLGCHWPPVTGAFQIPYCLINFTLKGEIELFNLSIINHMHFCCLPFISLRYTYQDQAVKWTTAGSQQCHSLLLLLTERVGTTRTHQPQHGWKKEPKTSIR